MIISDNAEKIRLWFEELWKKRDEAIIKEKKHSQKKHSQKKQSKQGKKKWD